MDGYCPLNGRSSELFRHRLHSFVGLRSSRLVSGGSFADATRCNPAPAKHLPSYGEARTIEALPAAILAGIHRMLAIAEPDQSFPVN